MDAENLGQAMGEFYREEMAKRALKENQEIRERLLLIEEGLTMVLNSLMAHGIYANKAEGPDEVEEQGEAKRSTPLTLPSPPEE